MTDLHSKVSRRTVAEHKRWKKRIIATLHPGDVVQLRLERSSRSYSYPIDRLYDLAEAHFARAVITGRT